MQLPFFFVSTITCTTSLICMCYGLYLFRLFGIIFLSNDERNDYMLRLVKCTQNMCFSSDVHLYYEEESICPICKAKIAPVYISSCLESQDSASVFNFCRSCNSAFITKYSVYKDDNNRTYSYAYKTNSIIYSEPNRFADQMFDDGILNLSPQFCKIYNQALAA